MRPFSFLLTVLCSLVVASAAHAIERPFPTNVTFGKFSPSAYAATGAIVIDGKGYIVTPATQIRDGRNRIIFPKSLSGSDVAVLYQKSHEGQINRIWILTNDEVQKYAPAKSATPPAAPPVPPISPTAPAVPDRTARGSEGIVQPPQTK